MASRGQWKVTKEYPEIKIAVVQKSYRITSNVDNKKHVNITYRKLVSHDDLQRVLKLSNTRDTDDVRDYHTVVEYTNAINPGCSLDINGQTVQITLIDGDEEASGTFDKI